MLLKSPNTEPFSFLSVFKERLRFLYTVNYLCIQYDILYPYICIFKCVRGRRMHISRAARKCPTSLQDSVNTRRMAAEVCQ